MADNYAAYLLEDDFFFIHGNGDDENGNPNCTLAGWLVDASGAAFSCSADKGLTVAASGENRDITLIKRIKRQTARRLTLEFCFTILSAFDGATFQLLDGDAPALKLGVEKGMFGGRGPDGAFYPLTTAEAGRKIGVKAVADLAAGVFDAFIDGRLIAAGLPLWGGAADRFLLGIPAETEGALLFAPVRIHTGYLLNEALTMTPPGAIPSDWRSAGRVEVALNNGTSHREPHAFYLEGAADAPASLSHDFTPPDAPVEIRFMFRLPDGADADVAVLSAGDSPLYRLSLRDGAYRLAADGGGEIPLAYPTAGGAVLPLRYVRDLWNTVSLTVDPLTSTCTLFFNYKKVAGRLPCGGATPDRLSFHTAAKAGAGLWVDYVTVRPEQPVPADYVPRPAPPAKTTDALIGMQYFPGWRVGTHISWDSGYRLPALDFYLGKYDEGCPEAFDWQTKWMTEHGVDFFFIDWYQNFSKTPDMPLQKPLYNYTFDGYFYSQYTDYLRFAIQVFGPFYTPEDYRNNIIPYWIHYYFTDPHYVVIDNKPLLGLGMPGEFTRMCGGVRQARELLAHLEEQCRAAGFDGLCVVATTIREHYKNDESGESLRCLAQLGVDGVYEYTYGSSGVAVMRELMEEELEMTTRPGSDCAGLDVIPTISAGWNLTFNYPITDGVRPLYTTTPAKDFDDLCGWVRDFSERRLPAGSLGKKLLLVDNWNEYTEGHAVNPGRLMGFSYLDSLGACFTERKNFYALDARPTFAQQLRMNNGFPKTWNGGHEWNFDALYDETEFWTHGHGVIDLHTDRGGHLCGNFYVRHGFSDNDITLYSPEDVGIDCAAAKICIRMRNNSRFDRASLYFTTDSQPLWHEELSIPFALRPYDPGFTEYVLDAADHPWWKGSIRQLCLRFSALGRYFMEDSFEIDYIRVGLEGPPATPKPGEPFGPPGETVRHLF